LRLEQADAEIARQVAAAGCPFCAGRLHRADYDRKPRGALLAPEGEASVRRFSLCCGCEGCRKRTTPPSIRFFGRRVYLEVVVLVASLWAQALTAAAELRRVTGVAPRTLRRWLSWWQGPFIRTEVFAAIQARLVGVDASALPASIVDRLGGERAEQVRTMLELLRPLTWGSLPARSSFSRGTA
jgi:hypothetical protein